MESTHLQTPPRTILEVFQMLPEGTLAELINGSLYMSPAPTSEHQRIIRKLSFAISSFVESKNLGEVFFALFDVYLDEVNNVVQPDIVFIPVNKSEYVKSSGMHGIPDLIIEILFSGNSRHDKVVKKEIYERFGVAEYWIVDPETKEAIGYTLQNGRYHSIGLFNGSIQSILLSQTFIY